MLSTFTAPPTVSSPTVTLSPAALHNNNRNNYTSNLCTSSLSNSSVNNLNNNCFTDAPQHYNNQIVLQQYDNNFPTDPHDGTASPQNQQFPNQMKENRNLPSPDLSCSNSTTGNGNVDLNSSQQLDDSDSGRASNSVSPYNSCNIVNSIKKRPPVGMSIASFSPALKPVTRPCSTAHIVNTLHNNEEDNNGVVSIDMPPKLYNMTKF